MLKKAGHIGVIILLLLATSGVNIYRHYCGSVLMQKTIQFLPEPCCSGHCKSCHDEAFHLKITDNFNASNLRIDFKTDFSNLLHQFQIPLLLHSYETESFDEAYQIRSVKHNISSGLIAEDSEAHLQVFRL